MDESKRGKPAGDRLSELPDSLIFNIFHSLPMKDVVRTALLSKRYENLWRTVPFLNFEGFDKTTTTRSIQKFITYVVMLWRGNKILKLKIDFGTRCNKSLYSDVDLLVRFGKESGVEELDIQLKYVGNVDRDNYNADSLWGDDKLYWAPQGLYSCSSIKRLYLKNCNLQIPTKIVCWNRLEYLRIDGYVVGQDLINKVLCGSPELEVLILQFIENHENFSIQSSRLRHVCIDKFLLTDDDPSEDTELRISTPNLQELEILGVPYSKFSMNDAPLLTCANIQFDGHGRRLFSGYDFVGKTLNQILPIIQHVKELMLSDWCIKALGDVKNRIMLSPFPKVEVLKLFGHMEEYENVVHLLEFFPQLEELVIERERGRGKKYHGSESAVEFEADFPDSFLQKLRTITITWAVGENSIFPLLEILLKYASNLKMMEFQSSNSLLLQTASEKVLRMPRSSPDAEFIIGDEWFC